MGTFDVNFISYKLYLWHIQSLFNVVYIICHALFLLFNNRTDIYLFLYFSGNDIMLF